MNLVTKRLRGHCGNELISFLASGKLEMATRRLELEELTDLNLGTAIVSKIKQMLQMYEWAWLVYMNFDNTGDI